MKKHLLIGASLCALSLSAQAQRIDFDNAPLNPGRDTEDKYIGWTVDKAVADTLTDIEVPGDETRKLTLVVNCGDQSVTNRTLKSNWWKDGVNKHSKLVGDCVAVYGFDFDGNTPQLTTESATMNLVFKGLSAGSHSLLAYLNVTDGNISSVAPIDVLVDGVKVAENIIMSSRAESPSASGQAYITFNAVEGADVTVSFVSKPEAGVTYGTSGIFLSGIVLDESNPNSTALDPYPVNLDYHVDADNGSLTLRWTKAPIAVSSVVYMGTSADQLVKVGETNDDFYTVSNLSAAESALNTYYWRVDEIDAEGNAYPSDVWSFRPRRIAFPGAEGYGKYAIGGRGGSVYHVTSLEDYSAEEAPVPGTFRYGLTEVDGPRTIVFDVSGTINLKSRLTCSDPYVTIAGQTAPGKGILFRGAPIGVASDGITRFVRMRRGYHNDDVADQAKGLDGLGMAGNNNAIMDHCSVGWTIDEAFSSRNAKNITLQRTLISEALNVANHPNYGPGAAHGYAATIGGDTATYHHNLFVHNEGRNWSLSGGLDGAGSYAGHHDVFNNVVYNWGGRATDGGTHECNFVNNYYKMGPATTQRFLLRAQLEGTGTGSQSYYVKGNLRINKDGSVTEDALDETYRYETSGGQVVDWTVFVDKPFFDSKAEIQDAKDAYKSVLSDVGANLPYFDEHDMRMVSETYNGTTSTKGSVSGKLGLIDRETDAEGYVYFPEVGETRGADFDTDGDGMPDWWEKAKGLNPNLEDNNTLNAEGYTALEEYLNWIAEPNYQILPGVESKIDLNALFVGFDKNSAFYGYECPDGWNVMDNSDGTLSIEPDINADGLFTIPVFCGDGTTEYTMTRNINLFVSSSATAIESPADIENGASASYQIYSVDGVLLKNGKDFKSLPQGIYILKVTDGKKVKSYKVVNK